MIPRFKGDATKKHVKNKINELSIRLRVKISLSLKWSTKVVEVSDTGKMKSMSVSCRQSGCTGVTGSK